MGSETKTTFFSYSFWCPPLYVFALLNLSPSTLFIEAHENYQKRSWRNRAQIIGPHGLQKLSIPLEKGKNNKMPIQSVRISNEEDWQTHHLRTIQTNYQSAPYFEHYFPLVENLYSKDYIHLWDWNWTWTQFWIQNLDFPVQLSHTLQFGQPEGSIDIMSSRLHQNINQKLNNSFWYPQVFEDELGFIREVSIMDALFCAGPETRSYLKTYFSPTFVPNIAPPIEPL